ELRFLNFATVASCCLVSIPQAFFTVPVVVSGTKIHGQTTQEKTRFRNTQNHASRPDSAGLTRRAPARRTTSSLIIVAAAGLGVPALAGGAAKNKARRQGCGSCHRGHS